MAHHHQPGLEVALSDLPEVYRKEQEPLYTASSSSSSNHQHYHPPKQVIKQDHKSVIHPDGSGLLITKGNKMICGQSRKRFWIIIAVIGALITVITAVGGGVVCVLGRQRQQQQQQQDQYAYLPV